MEVRYVVGGVNVCILHSRLVQNGLPFLPILIIIRLKGKPGLAFTLYLQSQGNKVDFLDPEVDFLTQEKILTNKNHNA